MLSKKPAVRDKGGGGTKQINKEQLLMRCASGEECVLRRKKEDAEQTKTNYSEIRKLRDLLALPRMARTVSVENKTTSTGWARGEAGIVVR